MFYTNRYSRLKALVAALFCGALSMIVAAEEISGQAHAIDGNRLTINGIEIRLFGIDAPERAQLCTLAGDDWPCGETAAKALQQIVANKQTRCTWKYRDTEDRPLGTCYSDNYDVSQLLVQHGLALADGRYSGMYLPDEFAAKNEKKGIWRAQFIAPSKWRKGERLAGNELPEENCPVKGVATAAGLLKYHLPGWPQYDSVKLDAARGDRCFQTVDAALVAGFTPAAH